MRRPPEGAVLFTGSSSIRLWTTLAQDLSRYSVVNRGFGGSQVSDCVEHFDLLVTQYRPRVVVLYSGGNDLAQGVAPEKIAANVAAFCARLHTALPSALFGCIQHAPQPARRALWPLMHEMIRLEKEFIAKDPRRHWIAVGAPIEDGNGEPDRECFIADGLHLSAKGYACWTIAVKAWLDGLIPS